MLTLRSGSTFVLEICHSTLKSFLPLILPSLLQTEDKGELVINIELNVGSSINTLCFCYTRVT